MGFEVVRVFLVLQGLQPFFEEWLYNSQNKFVWRL